MRVVVQRVLHASVRADCETIGRCGHGYLLYVAAHRRDLPEDAKKLAAKILTLRICGDSDGKMNLAVTDIEGSSILAISNFTLFGDSSKQRRPSFMESAPYERGKMLFDTFVEELRRLGVPTETGEFGAHMEVESVNNGPVTLILDVGPSGPAS